MAAYPAWIDHQSIPTSGGREHNSDDGIQTTSFTPNKDSAQIQRTPQLYDTGQYTHTKERSKNVPRTTASVRGLSIDGLIGWLVNATETTSATNKQTKQVRKDNSTTYSAGVNVRMPCLHPPTHGPSKNTPTRLLSPSRFL